MSIETPNLTLRPFPPRHQLALIEGTPPFAELFGMPAAEGLRDMFTIDAVSPTWLATLRDATETDPWAHGFAVIHRADQRVIGGAGFKGAPDEQGTVEIAYGIVPGYRRRGYATEAARGLIEFALSSGRVGLLCAHTLPEHNPSTRILTQCGFTFAGEINDPQDGLIWRWERAIPSSHD